MKKNWTFAAVFALALVTGCASTGTTGSAATAPPAAQPPVAVAPPAPAQPLRLSGASTKKVVLNMTGPANVTQAKDWAAFKEEWRATFADHAKGAGIAFDVQQGQASASGEPGILLDVYVNDYRMVGSARASSSA